MSHLSQGLNSNDRTLVENEPVKFYKTPLKKLSNRSNQIGNYILEETKYENVEEPKEAPPVLDMKEMSFRLHQTKIALEKQKSQTLEANGPRQSEPIYYRPSSSTVKDLQQGIKRFLPPNFKAYSNRQKNRIPLKNIQQMLDRNKIEFNEGNEEADEADEADLNSISNYPDSDWINPIFKEALRRQTSKTKEFYRLASVILIYLIYKLIRPIPKVLAYIFHTEGRHIEDTNWIMIPFWIFFFKTIYRLLKGSDQCYDLPLTNRQRTLLGLKLMETSDDDLEAEIELRQRNFKGKMQKVPKYPTGVSKIGVPHDALIRTSVDVSNTKPNDNQKISPRAGYPSASLLELDNIDLQDKFRRVFNMEFNYDEATS
ncbi:uncharacterized protein PRCAT00004748001 [Priceomyces carsonii]|uniref:uncharacterized protein n=1 Tax=Priceomyces carsonii TaxID=28549 RepID=UPI002ED822A1|nr:unnamed protein product [Priceomyces carsonii]